MSKQPLSRGKRVRELKDPGSLPGVCVSLVAFVVQASCLRPVRCQSVQARCLHHKRSASPACNQTDTDPSPRTLRDLRGKMPRNVVD